MVAIIGEKRESRKGEKSLKNRIMEKKRRNFFFLTRCPNQGTLHVTTTGREITTNIGAAEVVQEGEVLSKHGEKKSTQRHMRFIVSRDDGTKNRGRSPSQ
jgi:hypothetical protein